MNQPIDAAALRQVGLFAELPLPSLQRLEGIVQEARLPPETRIFSDGDAADRFYVIVSGKVRVSKQIPGMGEEALAILGPGDSFGEMALIDEAPRSADAITNTSAVLGVIDKHAFEQLLFTHHDLAHDLLWSFVRTLSARLRDSNEKMRAFLVMAGKF